MGLEKINEVMMNFDESYIQDLLGDLKNSLIEWSIDREMVTKKNMIDIIVSVNGLKLFLNPEFRYRYFLSFEKVSVLKNMAKTMTFNQDKEFDQTAFAKRMKKEQFSEKEPYIYFVRNYLGLNEYQFSTIQHDLEEETVGRQGEKFFELFDYQYMIKQQTINDLENPEKDLYKILIHMPTGTGKTKTTMHIISHYLNFVTKGKGTIIWIAHTNELLYQAFETFRDIWSHLATFDIDVYKGWIKYPETIQDGILFTSIQGLQAKMNKPIFDEIQKKASLIIFDEVHKSGAEKYKACIDKLMNKSNDYGKKFIGLTATPGRTTDISRDNTIFSEDFDHIIGIDVDKINSITLPELEVLNYRGSKDPIRYFQDRKILSTIEKRALDFELDDDIIAEIERQFRGRGQDYSSELINKIGLNKSRNKQIVDELLYLYENKIPTIVFACSVQHAKMLSAFLNMQNIPNSLVYGEMDAYSRKKAISDFKDRNNDINIIINYDILTTGFDSTNIKCVFITRPTKSVILYSQMIGRGLRGPKMGGNESCLLIDVKENLKNFNESDAFRHFNSYWKLEGQ